MPTEKSLELDREYTKNSFKNIADNYDQILFFKHAAQKMVRLAKAEHTNITQAKNILDVACGTGNVVVEFAKLLPNTRFHAIDISASMLTKAKHKALNLNLNNIHFEEGDINTINQQIKYDVITCAYALFFMPAPHRIIKNLQQHLAPNGILIFSSFQAQAFKPASDILLKLLRGYASPSALAFQEKRWQNLMYTSDLKHLCKLAKVKLKTIHKHPINHDMNPDEWWFLFNNTGYKGMLLELNSGNLNKLKKDFYTALSTLEAEDKKRIDLNADSFIVIVN